MSKAKNENERADPYRFQVREAEKSPVVLMYNMKQNEVLRKKLDFLESTKKTVVNRITINQKLTFIAYKKRLNKAKLAHAKLMGDKGEERDVRASGMKNSNKYVGVNGLTQEDEEALRNIWKTARPPPNLRESMGLARTVAKSPSGKSMFGTTTYNISTPEPTVVSWSRPSTGFSKIRLPGSPGSDDEDEVFDEVKEVAKGGDNATKNVEKSSKQRVKFGDQVDKNNNEYGLSSGSVKTLGGRSTNTVKLAWNQSSRGYAVTKHRNSVSKPGSAVTLDKGEDQQTNGRPDTTTPNIFEKDDRPTLLDVHRDRVKSADIPGRIDKLLDTMSPYMLDKRKSQRDCYSALLDKRAKDSYSRKCSVMGLNVVPDNHVKRETGNVDVRSLTVKPLKAVLRFK